MYVYLYNFLITLKKSAIRSDIIHFCTTILIYTKQEKASQKRVSAILGK